MFIFITFIRSTKRRRLVQERLEAWFERVDRVGLPVPNLTANVGANNLVQRLKNSRLWTTVGRLWSQIPCRRRPNLSSRQVLDNIIFKEKMEDKKGFNNQAYEEEERDEDPKEMTRADSVNKTMNPIWSVPHWRSSRSKTYFPNEVRVKNDNNDSSQQDDDIICENFADSVSLYSTYSQDMNQPCSPLENQQSQRPIFTQWNLLRMKSGSLNLPSGEWTTNTNNGRYNDVICQGLTRKDSFTKK